MLTPSLERSVPVYKWLRSKGPLKRKEFHKRDETLTQEGCAKDRKRMGKRGGVR